MKAEYGKSLSAQCAGAGVSANVPRRVGERDECVDGQQNGNEGRRTERKGGGGCSKRAGSTEKQGKKGKKVRKFSTSDS